MPKKIILIAAVIAAFLCLTLFGKPYFRRKNALKVVESVLIHWTNDDVPTAMSFWEREYKSPPVYDLLSYEIGKKTFEQKDDIYTARISATLYFPTGNQMPSGKEWIFELNKTRYGWKIMDFRISADQASQ
ncbi:MAG: hypothetical protein KAR31_08895 [Candidatus Omnitrophica bacterium]|nr:hypothetical protein [Candidatus Omnitrophota bacterium]